MVSKHLNGLQTLVASSMHNVIPTQVQYSSKCRKRKFIHKIKLIMPLNKYFVQILSLVTRLAQSSVQCKLTELWFTIVAANVTITRQGVNKQQTEMYHQGSVKF